MRKERVTATMEVAKCLFDAEAAIDQAYRATAELNAKMTVARIEANLSAVVGQEALESASDSLSALAQARHQMVKAHHQLDALKRDIGLRELMIGGGMQKTTGSLQGLRVVESQAA